MGSSSYITGLDGEVTQNIEYFPSGETFVENHRNSNHSPYKFNGKELDAETGYMYYGARYYNPRVSLWLNVDPLADFNPFYNSEQYIDGQHNGGVYNSGNLNPYIYCYQSPLKWTDPNGKQVVAVHGTWSKPDTWVHPDWIMHVAKKAFGNTAGNFKFKWSGLNKAAARKVAAKQLIAHILKVRKNVDPTEPITLVGHSHGGNVDVEAANIMVTMPEFKNVDINLITINTPVRADHQLSEEAKKRIDHINVYDPGDPVQEMGGKKIDFGSGKKGTGEFGPGGRTFENAINIEARSSQGPLGDFHNSHT